MARSATDRPPGPVPGRAVVTGAAGFVGRHLVAALAADGRSVIGIDRRPGSDVTAELLDEDLLARFAGAEVVFHLAGRASARASWGAAFDDYLDDNVRVTQRVLEAALVAGVPRVVVASSSSVYGDPAVRPTPEDAVCRPRSPYGASKLMAEGLAAAYGAQGLDVAVLRLFTVYGPGQRPDMLLARAIAAATGGGELLVFGDGRQTRDFTYVADAVAAIVRAGERGTGGLPVNVAGGAPVAIGDALALVANACGAPLRRVPAAAHQADARHTAADVERARALLGHEPRWSLAEGIAAQVRAATAARAG